jgi:hypothetical protein
MTNERGCVADDERIKHKSGGPVSNFRNLYCAKGEVQVA